MAKAKIIGKNWRQKQQLQSQSPKAAKKLGPTPSCEPPTAAAPTAATATAAKKKYKKKKHSLSSPSLGKYSPMLLRKVFQQQKESQLSKPEVRPESEVDDFFDEMSFCRLWASETGAVLHGEERTLGGGGGGGLLRRRGEPFFGEEVYRGEKNFLPLFGGTSSSPIANGSCSLASVQEEPVAVKKKKKSIIASLSLGPKDFPKKLQQNLASVNNQVSMV